MRSACVRGCHRYMVHLVGLVTRFTVYLWFYRGYALHSATLRLVHTVLVLGYLLRLRLVRCRLVGCRLRVLRLPLLPHTQFPPYSSRLLPHTVVLVGYIGSYWFAPHLLRLPYGWFAGLPRCAVTFAGCWTHRAVARFTHHCHTVAAHFCPVTLPFCLPWFCLVTQVHRCGCRGSRTRTLRVQHRTRIYLYGSTVLLPACTVGSTVPVPALHTVTPLYRFYL